MQPLSLSINVGEAGADDEATDELTRQLLRELRELDVESVDIRQAGPVPDGAKAIGATELGALVVDVLPVTLQGLMDFVKSWAERSSNRVVKINTQIGDRKLELEYNPQSVSTQEMSRFVATITDALSSAG